MITAVQHILQTGQLEPGIDPQVLREAKGQLEKQITQHQQLLIRIEQLLARQQPFGLDQMTPLSG